MNLNKPMAMSQAEFDTFVKVAQGVEVWRSGAQYIKTSQSYDQLAIDPRTAPRVLSFIVFSKVGYTGQYVTLAGAFNLGLGMPLDESARKAAIVLNNFK